MARALIVSPQTWIALFVASLPLAGAASAQTVWTGLTVEFIKPDAADPEDPANQDRITDNVILTRGDNRGIYNIAKETEYQFPAESSPSPIDTEWATLINNAGELISASNWAALEFDTWRNAYGGGVGVSFDTTPAVVHLITDNVYLDLQITSWTSSSGGGFSYMRSTGELPPPPTATGDYNGNDFVDAADYVVWRDTLTQVAVPPGSGADGNESGTIDAGDYDFWRARFGNTIPGGGAGLAAAIPEPACAVLSLLGLLGFQSCSGRRRRVGRHFSRDPT